LEIVYNRIYYRAFQISLIPPSGRDTTLKMAGYLKEISGRVENFGRFESFLRDHKIFLV